MKLLFDENLSPSLPARLEAEFPFSAHVQDYNFAGMPDVEIWRLAQEQGLTIVSCDHDFYALSYNRGAPPKVVWLQLGPANTDAVEACLREALARIQEFLAEADAEVLILP